LSDDTPDERPHTGQSLKKVAARGARFSIAGWGVSQALTFIAYVVLARLVAPAAFGSFTAGSLIVGFGLMFADSGTTAALIKRDDRIDEAASTAFYAQAVSGVLLSLLSLAVSPLIGLYFHDHLAFEITAALSGFLFLRALTIVPDALLQRRLSFARRVIVDPLGSVAFAAVAIAVCVAGAGVWGLVIGTYASEVVEVAAAWLLCGFRPRRAHASMELWREIAAFARPLVFSEVLRRIASNIDVLMLGPFASTATLGQYRTGVRYAAQPSTAFVTGGSYVLLPILSRVADQPRRLASAIRRTYGLAAATAAPVSAATVALGVPIAVLLLGDRWRPAGHAIAALWGLMLGGAFDSVSAESLKAVGRPDLLVRMHTLNLTATVVFVCAAVVPFGLIGVATAVSLSQVAVGIYSVTLTTRVTEVTNAEVLSELGRPIAASIVMLGVMLLFAYQVDLLSHGVFWGIVLTFAEVGIGAVVYAVLLVTIDPRRRRDLRNLAVRIHPSLGPPSPSIDG
jgi:O-antigen/teichoic acid export membrane protein